MAVTTANTKSVNKVNAPKIKVVNALPSLGNAEIATDDKKIHIRVATGWLKSNALS
jgi:hypothetical protein